VKSAVCFVLHHLKPNGMNSAVSARGPVRASIAFHDAATMRVHVHVIEADGLAKEIDRRTLIPEGRCGNQTYSSTKIFDGLHELLRDGAVQAVEETEVAVVRVARDAGPDQARRLELQRRRALPVVPGRRDLPGTRRDRPRRCGGRAGRSRTDRERRVRRRAAERRADALEHRVRATWALAEQYLMSGGKLADFKLVSKPRGGLTVVPRSDSRPEVDVGGTLRAALRGSVALGYLSATRSSSPAKEQNNAKQV
jgi:hypothetical protein